MLFWLVFKHEIIYRVIISWRILVSFPGFFWRLHFGMVKYLSFHNSSFCLQILFHVNGKATVWHTPCFSHWMCFWLVTQVLGGVAHATRPLAHVGTWHVTRPLVLVTWEVMGAKHDKAEKNRAKGRLKEKNCSSTIAGSAKVLPAFSFLPCRLWPRVLLCFFGPVMDT
jgi:hypothetical protein